MVVYYRSKKFYNIGPCLTGLDYSVLQIKTKIVSCHKTNSKSVKQEVDGTVILPPLVFPGLRYLG